MTDTNAADRMGSLFNDFLKAAEAIKERPQLEAKVRDAEAERDWAQADAHFARERLNDAQLRNDDLLAKIARLEADLAQATFREKAARESMDLVLGALKETMNNAKAAVELVEPPAPNPTPAEVTIDVPFPYTSRDSFESPSATISEPPNTPADTTTPVGFQSTGDGNDHPTPSYGIGAGDATPTLSAAPSAVVPPVPAEAPVSVLPYDDKPYWLKPDGVTWKEWTEGGGNKAHWVRETDWEWNNTYPDQHRV